MPGSLISKQWIPCAWKEHMRLSDFLIRDLDFYPTLEIFSRIDRAGLEDMWSMVVANDHYPCIYERNGKVTDIITTVEHALNLCQINKNSSIQGLNSAVQYFHDIGRSDILELQIICSL